MKKYGINVLASLLLKELVDKGRLQDIMMHIDGTEKTLSPDTGHCFSLYRVLSDKRMMLRVGDSFRTESNRSIK